MSYRKYIEEGKEPSEFVKKAANVGAKVSKGTGKAIEGVGSIGAGVLKISANVIDFIFSLATLPLREAFKRTWYYAQEGKKFKTRVVSGIGSAALALPIVAITLPGVIVYSILKKGEDIVKRASSAIAFPFDQLGDAILLEGDPKGYFDRMKELEDKYEEQQVDTILEDDEIFA